MGSIEDQDTRRHVQQTRVEISPAVGSKNFRSVRVSSGGFAFETKHPGAPIRTSGWFVWVRSKRGNPETISMISPAGLWEAVSKLELDLFKQALQFVPKL